MKKIKSEILRPIFDGLTEWIRKRNPGPASLDWDDEKKKNTLQLGIYFPLIKMTKYEIRFFQKIKAGHELNTYVPKSLRPLEMVQSHLRKIKGDFWIQGAEERGIEIKLILPTSSNKTTGEGTMKNDYQNEVLATFQRIEKNSNLNLGACE